MLPMSFRLSCVDSGCPSTVTDYRREPGDNRCCAQAGPGTQRHPCDFIEVPSYKMLLLYWFWMGQKLV
ncbi:hypothetical protein MRX96_044593 [Rhipicephalus microplus]